MFYSDTGIALDMTKHLVANSRASVSANFWPSRLLSELGIAIRNPVRFWPAVALWVASERLTTSVVMYNRYR